MRIVLCESVQDLASAAADLVLAGLGGQDPCLGLATGSSPEPLYEELVRRHRAGGFSFAGVSAFTLDEYCGVPKEDEQSYFSTIRRQFVDRVDLPLENLHTPDGTARDPQEAARRYDELIAERGEVDVQILGIGANGHLGFNEPTSSLASRTRVKTLSARTREDNARFFPSLDDVPRLCITQGLGTIGSAGSLVLVAQGEQKAEAVRDAVEGPLSAWCPASVLQLHPHATVLIDEAAGSLLAMKEYYRDAERMMRELGERD